jgi:hypothetical protein
METNDIIDDYTEHELTEALRAIDSMISKCEKAQVKLKVGSSQYTLLKNRLKAFYISRVLLIKAIKDC